MTLSPERLRQLREDPANAMFADVPDDDLPMVVLVDAIFGAHDRQMRRMGAALEQLERAE